MILIRSKKNTLALAAWIVLASLGIVLVVLSFRPAEVVRTRGPSERKDDLNEQDIPRLVVENQILKDQIRSLESLLLAAKNAEASHAEAAHAASAQHDTACDVQKHIHKKYQPQGMREVLDWESFDSAHIYSWRRHWQVMGHIGNSRVELQQVVQQGLQQLGSSAHLYKWAHGNVRVDQLRGVEYILDFVLKSANDSVHPRYRRINFLRPIMQVLVQEPDVALDNAQYETLHLILPLSGRTTMFRSFMKGLAAAVPAHSAPVHIVVVYFAEDNAADESSRASIEQLLEFYQHSHGFGFTIKVLMQPFSRGVGLETGALAITAVRDPLLFFCDVDMKFNAEFLHRCRMNAVPSKRMYFPIVFSLYRNKPNIVAAPNGAWRNYGLGMVCLYQSDFKALGGFSKTITGWGREDVDLYERAVKNGAVEVVRAVDDGITHIFHEKLCDEGSLTEDQFKDCIGSMADWEGTKVDLGKMIAGYRLQIGRMDAQLKEMQAKQRPHENGAAPGNEEAQGQGDAGDQEQGRDIQLSQ